MKKQQDVILVLQHRVLQLEQSNNLMSNQLQLAELTVAATTKGLAEQQQENARLSEQCRSQDGSMATLIHILRSNQEAIAEHELKINSHTETTRTQSMQVAHSAEDIQKLTVGLFVMSKHAKKLEDKLRAAHSWGTLTEAVVRVLMRCEDEKIYSAKVKKALSDGRMPDLLERLNKNDTKLFSAMHSSLRDYGIADAVDVKENKLVCDIFPKLKDEGLPSPAHVMTETPAVKHATHRKAPIAVATAHAFSHAPAPRSPQPFLVE